MFGLGAASPCGKYKTNEQLFLSLQAMDARAIACLQGRAEQSVLRLVRQYGLPDDTAEDILNQSALVLLQKIDTGGYTYQGNDPRTYLLEVAKRLVMKQATKRRVVVQPIEAADLALADADFETLEKHQHAMDTLAQLLTRLGNPCEQVIRLHYIDGYTDEEVINARWTTFSTIASLKVKRSDCMKKLIKIAQIWKTSRSS